MVTTLTWSTDECLVAIEGLEAQRLALVGVPTKGSVGKTMIDLTGKGAEIDAAIDIWRVRLQASRDGRGMAQRTRWGC